MQREVEKAKGLYLRVIDIGRGGPIVRQFRFRSIPHFILYNPDGKEIGRGGPAFFYQKIRNWNRQKWYKKYVKKKKEGKKKGSSVEKIKTISQGERVDIRKFLVKGKYTIVEFYADW